MYKRIKDVESEEANTRCQRVLFSSFPIPNTMSISVGRPQNMSRRAKASPIAVSKCKGGASDTFRDNNYIILSSLSKWKYPPRETLYNIHKCGRNFLDGSSVVVVQEDLYGYGCPIIGIRE